MSNKDSSSGIVVEQRRGARRKPQAVEDEAPRRTRSAPVVREERKKNDFAECSFITAKDDGKFSVCHTRLFCSICSYCSKHCLEHTGMTKTQLELNQDKKAIAD